MSERATTERLARGDRLHMELREGVRQWWFEGPYGVVADTTMRAILARPSGVALVEAGDSLFGLARNSQTWVCAVDGDRA